MNIMKRIATGGLVIAMALGVSGCDRNIDEKGLLMESKVEHVEDEDKACELLDLLGVKKELGEYHLMDFEDLQKQNRIKLRLEDETYDEESLNRKMRGKALLYLALVGDVESVEWVYMHSDDGEEKLELRGVDRLKAENMLGKDMEDFLKEYGMDELLKRVEEDDIYRYYITEENYEEKLLKRVLEYDADIKYRYVLFPFSSVVDEQLKWGLKDEEGNVKVEPEYDEARIVGDGSGYILTKGGMDYPYDLENEVVSEEGLDPEMSEVYLRNGNEIKDEIYRETFLDKVFCLYFDGHQEYYLPNGEYIGFIDTDEWYGSISATIERFYSGYFRSEGGNYKDGILKFNDEDKGFQAYKGREYKYVGNGCVMFPKEFQTDELKFYTLKNLKSGKESQEVYHNALRMGEGRILGVMAEGIRILDDDFNVLVEKEMDYYESYYRHGDYIVGKNEDIRGNGMSVYMNVDGEILWEENVVMDYQGRYIMRRNIDSLNTLSVERFFSDDKKAVEEYIDAQAKKRFLDGYKSLSELDREGGIWYSYDQVTTEEVGDIIAVEFRKGGRVFGGGHMGGSTAEVTYIDWKGNELSRENMFKKGWEEKVKALIREDLKEKREVSLDDIVFKPEKDGLRVYKRFYYKGIGDWYVDFVVPFEEMKEWFNWENEIVKGVYGELEQ